MTTKVIEFLKGLSDEKATLNGSTRKWAEFMIELTHVQKELEAHIADAKKKLLAHGKTVLVPSLEEKVAYYPESPMYSVDAPAVADYLIKAKRTDDLKKIISVTEKAVNDNLIDASEVLHNFKKETGKTKSAFLKVTKMTKQELHG